MKADNKLKLPEGLFAWLCENNGTISFYKDNRGYEKDVQAVRLTAKPKFAEEAITETFVIFKHDMDNITLFNNNIYRFVMKVQKDLVFGRDEEEAFRITRNKKEEKN